MKLKILALVLVLFTLSAFLLSCGEQAVVPAKPGENNESKKEGDPDDGDGTVTAPEVDYAEEGDGIKDGIIRIAIEKSGAPLCDITKKKTEYTLPAAFDKGNAEGFFVSYAAAVAEKLGYTPEIHIMDSASVAVALESGIIDCVISDISEKYGNEDRVAYSDTFFTVTYRLVAADVKENASNKDRETPVFTVIGEEAYKVLSSSGIAADIITATDTAEAKEQLLSGRADRLFTDGYTATLLVKREKELYPAQTEENPEGLSSGYRILCGADNKGLQKELNEAIGLIGNEGALEIMRPFVTGK